MEGWLVLVLVFGVIFFLLLIGIPIAFSILCGCIIGLWILGGMRLISGFMGYSLHHLMASYPIAVAPMFILVGALAEECGLGSKLYMTFQNFLGKLKGGLLIATTGAAAAFGAVSGSSIASAAMFSRIAIPELRKLGYDEKLSLGAIATAGGLATLIPPSVMVVFYGILTNVSIGKVLIAGIVPGILLSIFLSLGIYLRVALRPTLAPRSRNYVSTGEKLRSLVSIWPVLAIFIIIIGGIYLGFFTPTEAGACGTFIVLIYAIFLRIGIRRVLRAFLETASMTSQIFILIVGGMMLSTVVTLSGVTDAALLWMKSAELSLSVTWMIFILIYLILGAILDPISMLVLTLPISFPILKSLGVNPISLGVVVILLVEIAVITPPIGFNVYVVCAAANVDPSVGFRGSLMFFFILLLMLTLIILVPGLATWLPNLAFG